MNFCQRYQTTQLEKFTSRFQLLENINSFIDFVRNWMPYKIISYGILNGFTVEVEEEKKHFKLQSSWSYRKFSATLEAVGNWEADFSLIPVLFYGAETWTMVNRDDKTLRAFKRTVFRKVFGTVRVSDKYRRK